ncbi:MAG: thymidine kinase [Candidatus Aenigmarchaeota archaeon]|nr:thymidine kinase [Candidatus Aenigmarchaeota archaeon]
MINYMGYITGYVGNMFSGKSEDFIRHLVRLKIAGLEVLVFKPVIDDRYSGFAKNDNGFVESTIDTHSGSKLECFAVDTGMKGIDEIKKIVDFEERQKGKKIDAIGIDEANFFVPDIRQLIERLAYSENREVVWAGLDTDFRGEPFGVVPELLAISNEHHKLYAVCMKCGNRHATRSQRLDLIEIKDNKPVYKPSLPDAKQILVGTDLARSKGFPQSIYESRCVRCHEVTGKNKATLLRNSSKSCDGNNNMSYTFHYKNI